MMYTYEQDKIYYIRAYCKNKVLGAIKVKTNPTYINTYLITFKIIQSLENIFGKFDKVTKSDIFLYDPKFGMVVTNSKETFDKFFAKFTSAIILLNLRYWHKIYIFSKFLMGKFGLRW